MSSPEVPTEVGVVGGGRMGAGIGHAFLLAGAHVTVVESDEPAVASALTRLTASMAKASERGTLGTPVDEVRARLTVTTDSGALAGSGLVIEAVPEDPELKARIMATLEEVAPDAYLATNTSALSIDELASRLRRPERFVGLHFFNPVPASALVEIVVGDRTAPDLASLARAWVSALGKTPIIVTDSPGFASSRLGVAIALEAIRMLEEGVASAGDIDAAMTLGYRHPMGPLKTTDVVGLDVRLAIAENLTQELGDRFEPPPMLRRMVEAGHLGRKTGQGFYSW